ncbi:hypothetical protein TrCOL_g6315 [Triparma columacea]|uniref:Uncharacterized protein n=1 Tax=Triparma columacea TaxID=722753 RepID=A0A9W7GBJ5_9STRA|nr:hypothetical protein TrCOL_g6315 [Triparma columacea]
MPTITDKENSFRPTSSLFSPGYADKLAKKAGNIPLERKKGLKETTPSKLNIRNNRSNVSEYFLAEAKSDATTAPSFGAFGSLLMDAAKDAQDDRDSIHARRVERREMVAAEKQRREEEEEGKKTAERLEEEENDKLLATRLLQEERAYQLLEEENRRAQEKRDEDLAMAHQEEVKRDIMEEEKKMEEKDVELAKRCMREEKDAILAERIAAAEEMAQAAQEKIEKQDFAKAMEIQRGLESEHAKECEAKESYDKRVAKSYVMKDQRLAHREARNQTWLDTIAAQYFTVYGEGGELSILDGDEDKMSEEEFKLCHDFAAWQDAQMEIHDVMGGICVSARLPRLSEVDFEVHPSGKEVELMCTSEDKAGHETRLVHKNIELYHDLMKRVYGERYVVPPPCDVEKVSTYSIHLQLDACVGVGVTPNDISYVYEQGSGVLYLYLNGLKLRAGDKSGLEEKDERENGGVSRGKSSLLKRMVDKVVGGRRRR